MFIGFTVVTGREFNDFPRTAEAIKLFNRPTLPSSRPPSTTTTTQFPIREAGSNSSNKKPQPITIALYVLIPILVLIAVILIILNLKAWLKKALPVPKVTPARVASIDIDPMSASQRSSENPTIDTVEN